MMASNDRRFLNEKSRNGIEFAYNTNRNSLFQGHRTECKGLLAHFSSLLPRVYPTYNYETNFHFFPKIISIPIVCVWMVKVL